MATKYSKLFDGQWHTITLPISNRERNALRRRIRAAASREGLRIESHFQTTRMKIRAVPIDGSFVSADSHNGTEAIAERES